MTATHSSHCSHRPSRSSRRRCRTVSRRAHSASRPRRAASCSRKRRRPSFRSDNFWYAADDWRACYRPYVVADGILQIPSRACCCTISRSRSAVGRPATSTSGARSSAAWPTATSAASRSSSTAAAAWSPAASRRSTKWSRSRQSASRCAPTRTRAPTRQLRDCFSRRHHHRVAHGRRRLDWRGHVARRCQRQPREGGVKVTFIFAGKHKVDGNAYEPLPADVKARIQERIDELYGIFVGTVAQNRGLDEQAVRDTEALTFTASQATSNGLADAIGTLDDALAAFAADLSNPQGDEEMSTQDSSAGDNQAAIDTAVAAATRTTKRRSPPRAPRLHRLRSARASPRSSAATRRRAAPTSPTTFALETDMRRRAVAPRQVAQGRRKAPRPRSTRRCRRTTPDVGRRRRRRTTRKAIEQPRRPRSRSWRRGVRPGTK
jgi:hypothetical protein